jgi:hypothetical protein
MVEEHRILPLALPSPLNVPMTLYFILDFIVHKFCKKGNAVASLKMGLRAELRYVCIK